MQVIELADIIVSNNLVEPYSTVVGIVFIIDAGSSNVSFSVTRSLSEGNMHGWSINCDGVFVPTTSLLC